MTSRFSRIVKRVAINPLLAHGRKPRIVPMSAEEQRVQDELHRRREALRREREASKRGPQP